MKISRMSRRRKIIWLGSILLALAGGFGGFCWYWHATAVDSKVCQLVYEAAGYPDTGFELLLKKIGLDFLLREKPKQRDENVIADEMAAIGNAATPGLVSLLDNKNRAVRIHAIMFLGQVGNSRAVDPLLQTLQNDHDTDICFLTVLVLEKINDKKMVGPLIKILPTSRDGRVRACAVLLLAGMDDKRAVEPLIQVLRTDEDRKVRHAAAVALGKLDDKKAVEPLIYALLNDEDVWVRNGAAESLGKLGDPRGIKPLEDAMRQVKEDEKKIFRDAIDRTNSTTTKPGNTTTSPASGPSSSPPQLRPDLSGVAEGEAGRVGRE